ncbi:unconventional myosin-XIX-like isoform X2 [Lineus longissimus]|uniref:unconventional myosin-XIX-like isoform X2 n=1 Tax=Lineus longissimus TaxID=88925 RepID=UPI00315D6BD3
MFDADSTKEGQSPVMTSDVCNLISLSPINEDAVVQCLCSRYRQAKYYTWAGSTLVAINPFKDVPDLYSRQTCSEVIEGSFPHVYCTADEALKCCQGDYSNANQSIIVSGESGAGKTVSAKHLLRYLTRVSRSKDNEVPKCNKIEQGILDSNPILEAFGNAMTVRNANSSRFGKYIQLQLQGNSEILGANIQTYLLEKTRIVHQSCRESNFHVFYQMLQGATAEERAGLNLGSSTSKDFAYLKNGWRNNDLDQELWLVLNDALKDISLDGEARHNIFQLLAALLHLGNTTFDVDEEDDTCDINKTCSEDNGCLTTACQMLSLDQSKLEKSITHRQISASHARRKSIFYKPCTLKECQNRRDCLARLLYSRLFEWLVDYINGTIQAKTFSKTIGILDIYGFESFNHNSLEQLCINYANEKLQQHFVGHFLRDLQEEYQKEAISWNYTNFVDNSACLDLLESNPSVFALLNEECSLNRQSDDFALCDRLDSSLRESRHWSRPRDFMRTPGFIVKHYAGCVQYGIEDLVDKNKDNVPLEFISLLQRSESTFIQTMFENFEVDTVGKKRKTVLSKFKGSLDSLMSLLKGTNPHYIRCIKPNTESQPGVFDNMYVRKQLEACGVMETVHICKQGYPARFPYPEFLQRYGIILRHNSGSSKESPQTFLSDHSDDNKENEQLSNPLDVLYQKQLSMRTTPKKNATPKKRLRRRAGLSYDDHSRKCCATIMKDVFGSEFMRKSRYTDQFGRTKLFLKQGQLEELEKRRSDTLGKYASTIQGAWKNHKKRKEHRLLNAVLRIQACKHGLPPSKAPLAQVLDEMRIGGGQTYPRIPYLEGMAGLISKRRMPRVPIKFHTRANTILKNAHLISQREFSCSLTDCLSNYDEVD